MKTFVATLSLALVAATAVVSKAVIVMPVASFVGEGGGRMHVAWNDDRESPRVNRREWGDISLWLATGSVNTQYKLQELETGADPSKDRGTYRINPNAGPDGDYYFIRMEGTQTGSNGFPVMAFSARFALNNMRGEFNSTVMAEAQGTAPTGGPTSINEDGEYVSTYVDPAATETRSTQTPGRPTSAAASSQPTGAQRASDSSSGAGRVASGVSAVAAGAVAVVGALAIL